jgi:hypothetical protein
MTRTRRRAARKRITPYLPADLAQRLATHCAAQGITESGAVETAVRLYLDDTSDKTLVLRSLDRFGRALDRVLRDGELHTEAFVVFIKLWLGYLPNVSAEARRDALAAADGRYKRFVELLQQRISRRERLAQVFPHEPVADPRELATTAQTPALADPLIPKGR